MSKKSRSTSKRQTRAVPASPSSRTAPATTTSTPARAAVSRPFEREFTPDYGYVFKDLKRIGTLAGTFFLLLVVLSFFLK